jgi:superfamily I DNA/RNA helicase
MRLLGEGRRPELIGNDVVKGLLRDLKRLGPPQTRQEDALASVDAWETEQERRYKGRASTADKAECMRIFVRAQPTLGAALAYAEQVVNASGVIKLMTGHKSKGLEFDVVYFLDEHLVKRGEDAGQDTNLRYVICTRTKDRLIYITSEGYNGANDDS